MLHGPPSTLGTSGTESVHLPTAPPLAATPASLLPSARGSEAALYDSPDPRIHPPLWGPLGLCSTLPASMAQTSAEGEMQRAGVSGKSPSPSQAAPCSLRALSCPVSTPALPPALPFPFHPQPQPPAGTYPFLLLSEAASYFLPHPPSAIVSFRWETTGVWRQLLCTHQWHRHWAADLGVASCSLQCVNFSSSEIFCKS